MKDSPRRVVITGVGVVSPVADDVPELWNAADAGRAPGTRRPDFALNGMPGPLAAVHDDFDARAELGRAGLRPLDRTGRLASVAAKRALEDSGWSEEDLREREVGLVLGTMFGSLRTISGFDRRGVSAGPSYAKPLDFVNSVINAAAGQTAIRFDLRGTNATVSGDLTSGLQAVAYAADAIRGGKAEALLAGGAEELCAESLYGFHKLGMLCSESVSRAVPFGTPETGMTLAETATLIMLESLESARERGATILGEVLGHGSAFDPTRGESAESLARAMADATRAALTDAERAAADVGCVSLGANGTRLDRPEAAGVVEGLGRSEPVPALAGKAATGETLGASGTLQMLLGLESLRRGRVPGIAGLDDGGPSGLAVRSEDAPTHGSATLVSAVGLQGKATALLAEVAS